MDATVCAPMRSMAEQSPLNACLGIRLVVSNIKDICRQYPSSTIQDMLRVVDDSLAFLEHVQAEEWLRAALRGGGTDVLKVVDDMAPSRASASGVRRRRQIGEMAL